MSLSIIGYTNHTGVRDGITRVALDGFTVIAVDVLMSSLHPWTSLPQFARSNCVNVTMPTRLTLT